MWYHGKVRIAFWKQVVFIFEQEVKNAFRYAYVWMEDFNRLWVE